MKEDNITLQTIGDTIVQQQFLWSTNTRPFLCLSSKILRNRLILYTECRTFVIMSSELEKLKILENHDDRRSKTIDKTEKTKELIAKIRKKSSSTILSEDEKRLYKERFYVTNFGKTHVPFTSVEDELIRTVSARVLVDILGRKYSSISVRKHNLLNTIHLNKQCGAISHFTSEQDEFLINNDNNAFIEKYKVSFSKQKINARRANLKLKHKQKT